MQVRQHREPPLRPELGRTQQNFLGGHGRNEQLAGIRVTNLRNLNLKFLEISKIKKDFRIYHNSNPLRKRLLYAQYILE